MASGRSFQLARTAEAQLNNITARLDRPRRDVPRLLRLLVEAAIHRSTGCAAPFRVSNGSLRDARAPDRHDHGNIAPKRWVRFLAELRIAEPGRALLTLDGIQKWRRCFRE